MASREEREAKGHVVLERRVQAALETGDGEQDDGDEIYYECHLAPPSCPATGLTDGEHVCRSDRLTDERVRALEAIRYGVPSALCSAESRVHI